MRVSLSLCTFLHLLLFNFQGPSLACRLFMRLIYYITFPCVCQGVLQKFFKFFLKLFRFAVPSFAWLRPLYYITFSSVCQVVLRRFFKSFSKPLGSLPLLTRPVYYIILHRVRQEVLQKFFESFLQTLRPACFREALSLTAHIL